MNSIISIESLTKYYGKFLAVSDISFSVNKGEIFGLIGPNGAGKSTTMRSILNFIKPTEGKITIKGLDSQKDYIKIRNLIGYLPGEFSIYDNLSAEEYISHILHLRNKSNKIPNLKNLAAMFDLDLSKKSKKLSKGNKQKVGIIQAFCHDPEILILDEPTSGLDPLKQQEFEDLVLEFKNQGKTIFISSHVLPEVETLCDRVAIIKNGQIIAEDKMADLKKKSINRIEVQFSKDFDVDKLRKNIGISKVTGDSNKYTFDIEGNIDKFIKELANHEIENLKTIEPDLEDIFLSYYREQKG
ncbi:MAG TPA: ABC transporter ATP-binding protein [Dehalococcoidia bacterium]|jgi:ABC-2 type transport system ATP-binding protein|nr:ABC transporter ATP-binding protein [Dehalococcoidia bacterium]